MIVAIAGTCASLAAFWSLFQQHDRERTFSEVIATEAKHRLALGDPRREALQAKRSNPRRWQRVARLPVPAWVLWLATLVFLIAADWMAFVLTERAP